MYTILVQLAEEVWTMKALHLACTLARTVGGEVALLRLMQVDQPGFLGTPFGNQPPDERERRNFEEYAATAEDYDVPMTLVSMQCMSSLEAVADAAEQLDAKVVFAHVPPSRIPYWRRFQVWNMQRALRPQRQLFTLDQPISTIGWSPAMTVKASTLLK